MFNALQALGYGIIGFAIIVGIGSVVLSNLSGALGNCGSVCGSCSWNNSFGGCFNTTGGNGTPTAPGYVTTNYLLGQLGSTGLAGWTPAIIALSVGMLFLGAFLVGKGRERTY